MEGRNGRGGRRGILLLINLSLVSGCEATHWSSARALQTRLLAGEVRVGGERDGYILMISCTNAEMVPKEYHKTGARSGKVSLRLLSSTKAFSLCETNTGSLEQLSCHISFLPLCRDNTVHSFAPAVWRRGCSGKDEGKAAEKQRLRRKRRKLPPKRKRKDCMRSDVLPALDLRAAEPKRRAP